MAHQKATQDEARKHREATKHLTKNLDANRVELKKLLAPDLAETYSLCYWADDGCLWCSDDGHDWYRVRCIS